MRITALVESPDHVCCRYRVAAYEPYFRRAGHQLTLRPWPKSWWSRLQIGRLVEDADIVLLQRRLLPSWQLYLLRSNSRRLVFDFDDSIFHRDSYARKGIGCPRRLAAFAAMCETADKLLPGNAYLKEHASRWARGEQVHPIPTCVDPVRYSLARHKRVGRVAQLVWIGSSSTLQGLERAWPLMNLLGRRCPSLALKVICDRFPRFRDLPVIPRIWSSASETRELAASDIGISWVPDDDWSRGKCGLKLLQYMAAGLPIVANPVGVQSELVRHGENGFLAETEEEWIEAISWLRNDPDLRRRMGLAGRRRVEEEFSLNVGASLWLHLLSPARQRSVVA
jgi:glycosyltransferase involved in cell wall biosynthesis